MGTDFLLITLRVKIVARELHKNIVEFQLKTSTTSIQTVALKFWYHNWFNFTPCATTGFRLVIISKTASQFMVLLVSCCQQEVPLNTFPQPHWHKLWVASCNVSSKRISPTWTMVHKKWNLQKLSDYLRYSVLIIICSSLFLILLPFIEIISK